MKKKVFGRKFSRNSRSREALFASLIRSMILNGKIETTRAKAKAVQGDLEKFVTLAKKAEISGRRRVLANLDNARDAVDYLFKKIGPAFSGRVSGYTRIISLPSRKGDNAQMVRLEWTQKIINNEELKSKSEKVSGKVKSKEKVVKTKSKKTSA